MGKECYLHEDGGSKRRSALARAVVQTKRGFRFWRFYVALNGEHAWQDLAVGGAVRLFYTGRKFSRRN